MLGHAAFIGEMDTRGMLLRETDWIRWLIHYYGKCIGQFGILGSQM